MVNLIFSPAARGIDRLTALLLRCGLLGAPIFVVVALIEGATRPGYDAYRNMVSALSLSSDGWMQILNFAVCGTLMLCFAGGLRRALGDGTGATGAPVLVGVFAAGLLIAGAFTTDPAAGYPAGTPLGPAQGSTIHGTLHFVGGALVFTALPAACFALARRFWKEPAGRPWAMYSMVAGAAMFAFFVASDAAALQPGLPASYAGLLQRIAIVSGWSWVAATAWRSLRSAS